MPLMEFSWILTRMARFPPAEEGKGQINNTLHPAAREHGLDPLPRPLRKHSPERAFAAHLGPPPPLRQLHAQKPALSSVRLLHPEFFGGQWI